jgi:predicted AAA+ superfamily ATPase
MIIKRDIYLNKLIDSMNNGLIKVITGIRRCGKSFLLFNLFDEYLRSNNISDPHIIKIALDDRTNKKLRDPDELFKHIKERILDNEIHYILLDEIQIVPEFEDVLNSLLHISNVDVYVTGSNSKFLSSDIATEFKGRGDEIHVLPLSFSEFTSVYSGTLEEAFNEYMLHGGMPLSLVYKTDDKKEDYLKNLFQMTYLTDIVERHKIKDSRKIDELIRVLASSIGSLINSNKIANTYQSTVDKTISVNTIDDYLKYLEESYIIKKAERYDIKGRKNIAASKKYYFVDPGLRNAKLDFLQSDFGHVMENIIYNELVYRGYSVNVGVVVINSKNENNISTRTQLEVDFVATKGSKKYYIQSAYKLYDESKVEQERRSLINIDDSFKKIIVVRDPIKVMHDEYGITSIGIVEFLSNVNSMDL